MHIIYKCLGQSYAGQQKNSLAIDSWTTALKYQDDPDLRSKMEELQQSNKWEYDENRESFRGYKEKKRATVDTSRFKTQ